jgi:hypothetical protein
VIALVASLLLALPTLYWPFGIERAADVKSAGIAQIAVPPDQVEAWRALGFAATGIGTAELAARETLQPPGILARPTVASPTRSPWANANGWRVLRNPSGKFVYELPAGAAPLAAAEAYAYGADAVLKIDPKDLPELGRMLTFLKGLPEADLPGVADVAVVDDGSAEVGEVMNLLVRRNLLFRVARAPVPGARITIQLGTKEFPRTDAADPSAFALKIRRQLTDEQRSLRIYGSDTVIARFTSDNNRARIHLLNYARRETEGLRVRVRGSFPRGEAYLPEKGRVALVDQVAADGVTEFSLPVIGSYVVIDLGQR